MADQIDPQTVPRGRHAPPLEVRLSVQRRRLYEAAANVFARVGYADASAEAISREAGMSKATFYEHFANKEECLLALFDEAATEIMRGMAGAATDEDVSYEERIRANVSSFLEILTEYPNSAQTLLVEVIGAGPRAAERRDAILDLFAEGLMRDNARMADRIGPQRLTSQHHPFAILGAILEQVSRQLPTRVPPDVRLLEPAFERLLPGPGDATLDLGCGVGRVGVRLRELGHRVTGVDASPTRAAAARDRGVYEEVVETDAATLPFGDDAFDLAIAFMALHDMDDPSGAVGEAARVLERSGRFAIATLHPLRTAGEVGGYLGTRRYDVPIERDGLALTFSSMHYSIEAYAGMLRGAGFVIEDLCELPVEDRRTPDLLHLLARKP